MSFDAELFQREHELCEARVGKVLAELTSELDGGHESQIALFTALITHATDLFVAGNSGSTSWKRFARYVRMAFDKEKETAKTVYNKFLAMPDVPSRPQ